MNSGIAIVGAGQAGSELARSLRHGGYAGAIRMFGRETLPPYQRPPLSKKVLLGGIETERLLLGGRDSYERLGIELFTGSAVESIDFHAGELSLGSEAFAFDACVLATGAEARRPAIEGAGLDGVHVLRTMQDALELRAALAPGSRLVVVGGGYLGLEVASAARTSGVEVTVIEAAGSVMQRSISSIAASLIETRHRAAGTRILLNASVERIEGERRVERVIASSGQVLRADAILLAVGAAPSVDLAQLCGLQCDNGILVDANCRTSAANVYAIGDCACQYNPEHGAYLRMEAVNPALAHARRVSADLLGKQPPPQRPFSFWTEQYDFTMQIVGVPAPGVPCEDVLRGDPSTAFSVYRFQDGRLVAVEAFNRPRDFVQAHSLLGRRDVSLPVN